jgi:hypothetical protein
MTAQISAFSVQVISVITQKLKDYSVRHLKAVFPFSVKIGDQYCLAVRNPVSLSRANCEPLHVSDYTNFLEC